MFYEMCFPFTTNMERVNVLMGLSKKIFAYPKSFDLEQYSNQIKLIEKMLQDNPGKITSESVRVCVFAKCKKIKSILFKMNDQVPKIF